MAVVFRETIFVSVAFDFLRRMGAWKISTAPSRIEQYESEIDAACCDRFSTVISAYRFTEL